MKRHRLSAISYQLVFATATLGAMVPLNPCAAQSDSRLVAAVRLAQEGQGDSARAQVKRILDATPVADPLYAEALYASGVVAVNATEMERQLRRLVVEYNGSAWSDDALLRLMQLNFAQGDLPGVTRTAERLAADYPQSEVIPDAALWAARAYFRQSDTGSGCRWLADGLARADTANVELRNGLVFLNGRCGQPNSATGGPVDSARPTQAAPVRADTVARPPVLLSTWTIQVAVASSRANADALIQKLTREGLPGGRIFAEGGVFKVRLGRPNANRPAVEVQLLEVRKKYPQAFVVEEHP